MAVSLAKGLHGSRLRDPQDSLQLFLEDIGLSGYVADTKSVGSDGYLPIRIAGIDQMINERIYLSGLPQGRYGFSEQISFWIRGQEWLIESVAPSTEGKIVVRCVLAKHSSFLDKDRTPVEMPVRMLRRAIGIEAGVKAPWVYESESRLKHFCRVMLLAIRGHR